MDYFFFRNIYIYIYIYNYALKHKMLHQNTRIYYLLRKQHIKILAQPRAVYIKTQADYMLGIHYSILSDSV